MSRTVSGPRLDQWQYSRDSEIQILANKLSKICTPKNSTLSIGNSKYRYANKVLTAHSHNKTKSFIVLSCLHFSIFVYIFQSLFTFFNICTQIFTLSISPRRCRDSISFAYSCSIPESLLYCHWCTPSLPIDHVVNY